MKSESFLLCRIVYSFEGSTIVYCHTKAQTEEITRTLQSKL